MGGTREGGLKAAQKLKEKDPDHFKKLRARVKQPVGGKHSANGFDADPERARSAGAKGGRVSRRGKPQHDQEAPDVPDAERQAEDQPNDGDHTRGGGSLHEGLQPTDGGGEAR